MRVRCIYNTGEDLRRYENKPLIEEELGRFKTTSFTQFGEIEIGKEYLVMGIIIFESYQSYLVDDSGVISACPCQLFEVIDDKINATWHFRLIEENEDVYPFVQAIYGYSELCLDKKSYENLIVEQNEEAMRTYFRRKIELEKELSDRS